MPWYTRDLARRREDRQAGSRGELSTHMVDLLEGAPELVAFGAADAQLARVAAADAELTRIASAGARTAGVGSGLVTLLTGLAVWGSLLVGVPAVHSGRLAGPCWRYRPHSAGGVRDRDRPARRGPEPERVRQSAARVFVVTRPSPPSPTPLAPKPLPAPPYGLASAGSAPGTDRSGRGRSTESISTCRRGAGSASSAPAAPANRPWPRCCSGSCPTKAR